MTFMNLNYGLILFEDEETTNPQIRISDISKSYRGVGVRFENSKRVMLYPNSTTPISATLRSLNLDATTQFHAYRPIATLDVIRLQYTGTGSAPNFRTKRNLYIDATTTITLSRISPNAVRLTSVAGTTMNTTSVVVGDTLQFGYNTDSFISPFSSANVGQFFRVQAKGTNTIDVIDNGSAFLDVAITLGISFDTALRVFSDSGVQVDDSINLAGSTFNSGNLGQFSITSVSYDYVEFVNPFAVEETVLNTDNEIVIYDHLIEFMHIRGSGSFKLRINDNDAFELSTIQGECVFLGTVKAYKIEAINDSTSSVSVLIQDVSVIDC